MDRLISLQAAIDEWKNDFRDYVNALDLPRDDYNGIMEYIDELPFAQPERKKGKWNFIGDQMFECTECGTCYTQGQFHQMRVRITDSEFPKFCPNCGADMKGDIRNE